MFKPFKDDDYWVPEAVSQIRQTVGWLEATTGATLPMWPLYCDSQITIGTTAVASSLLSV